MDEKTDLELLRSYARNRSEPAFTELVRRHIDLVHSAALRMVRDSHLAEEVTHLAASHREEYCRTNRAD